MQAREREQQISWSHTAAMLSVIAGLLLVALSLVWPRVFTGHSNWPDDKAGSYQQAASRLHSLSMKAAGATAEEQTRAAKEELAKAEAEYARLRNQLDAARAQPRQIAQLLRYAGAALLVVGTIGLLIKR